MSARPPDDPGTGDAPDSGLGRHGWALVAVLIVAFGVAPGLILLRPPAVPFEVAFLALPLLPAVALGLVAVWAAMGGSERRPDGFRFDGRRPDGSGRDADDDRSP